jgi:hypothetical protein
MIRSEGVRVWTNRGWIFADELLIGDRVISYNHKRNCTEYDTVRYIKTEYKSQHFLGIKFKSLNISATKDHPVLIYDESINIAERKTMDEIFLSKFSNRKDAVLYNSWFEPYDVNISDDDLLWSARLAASFTITKNIPGEYRKSIWDIIENINGYQAQEWINELMSWNRQVSSAHWMKSIRLSNNDVRAMIFHVGVKAGLGIKFHSPGIHRRDKTWVISAASNSLGLPDPRTSYFQSRETTHSFNIATRNGSFMARHKLGTFLMACEIKEDIKC